MMGLSGTLVTLESGILPLEDIATGLSRIPRFAGQTVGRWSVCDHLLAGMLWTRKSSWCGTQPCARNGATRELHFALHDAHEAMTSDVPTTFKTDDLRAIQRRLDSRLYVSLGLYQPDWREEEFVHLLDSEMLLAEAAVVTPSTTYRRIVAEKGGREATHTHRVAVAEVLSWNLDEYETADLWLTRTRNLIEEVKGAFSGKVTYAPYSNDA